MTALHDTAAHRKARGAFFTPDPIARFLTEWAIGGNPRATVLDPTCGEAVFLLRAADELRKLGARPSDLVNQVFGVDIHHESLRTAGALLEDAGLAARLICNDFFAMATPDQLGAELPLMDAVVGNPPFIRYQNHSGSERRRSVAAALRQGVRLTGLASSWAATVVHASGFLKPEGRLAMVVPAELLTVGYAEPIRQWLRKRFAVVHLVLFEELQFEDVEENVLLLVARGSGGCNAFTLYQVRDAAELESAHMFDGAAVAPEMNDKWTDLLLPEQSRGLYRQISEDFYCPLSEYATVELGTVTGANNFFTLTEATREEFGLIVDRHVIPTAPPGTRHIKGATFTRGQWEQLKLQGERVWMLNPTVTKPSGGLAKYLKYGESLGVPDAYKCSIRSPWWRPPITPTPDLFFTYMSHHLPRLIANDARTALVNSMHGVRIREGMPDVLLKALPFVALNSLTALGAELIGRSYGGGILKMEPREASKLPVPKLNVLETAWQKLEARRLNLDGLLRSGRWDLAVAEVDRVLLDDVIGLSARDQQVLQRAARQMRARRQRRSIDG